MTSEQEKCSENLGRSGITIAEKWLEWHYVNDGGPEPAPACQVISTLLDYVKYFETEAQRCKTNCKSLIDDRDSWKTRAEKAEALSDGLILAIGRLFM